MVDIAELIQQSFGLNQSTSEFIAAAITFLVAAVAGFLVYYAFARYICRWARKSESTLDDKLLRTLRITTVVVVILAGSYYSLTSLSVLEPYSDQLAQLFMVLAIALSAFAITSIINVLADWFASRNNNRKARLNNHILFILKKVIQIIIYVIGFFAILAVFNYDLSGVVVG